MGFGSIGELNDKSGEKYNVKNDNYRGGDDEKILERSDEIAPVKFV